MTSNEGKEENTPAFDRKSLFSSKSQANKETCEHSFTQMRKTINQTEEIRRTYAKKNDLSSRLLSSLTKEFGSDRSSNISPNQAKTTDLSELPKAQRKVKRSQLWKHFIIRSQKILERLRIGRKYRIRSLRDQ